MNGQSLKDLVASNGIEWTVERIDECMDIGRRDPRHEAALRPEHFSIRELAEAFCGYDWVRRLNPANVRRQLRSETLHLTEAGESVDVSAFSNITGQIFFNKIRDGWELAQAIGDQLVETQKTDLDGEKIPWLTPPLTEGAKVHPGMPYPEAALGEEWIQTPSLDTYGAILSIHKNTIFYDRTGQMLRRANGLGKQLRYNKERRILNTFLGATNPPNQQYPSPLFNWKGVSYVPYQVAGTYWSNSIPGNELIDWKSIQAVEIAATNILEPDLANAGINTPIDINLDTIVCMPAKEWDLDRVLHATQIRSMNLGAAPNQQTIGGNVLKTYKPLVSKLLRRQAIDALALAPAVADNLWWMMDSAQKPIAYMEAWPLTLVQAPPQSIAEFERDIVFRIKASERGTTAWIDPRYVFFIQK